MTFIVIVVQLYIGDHMEERKTKRLVVELNFDLHQKIKMLALRRNISLSNWIHRAIFERIAKEGIKENDE